MSTVTFTSPIDHTSNAGFDAWATELFNNLAAVNSGIFAQTADTGQLATPVVAARPGTNTAAGYWIFKLSDGVATDIYFKIEVGTGSSAANPRIWITNGTGTNGAGTLTGTVNTRSSIDQNNSVVSTVTNYASRLCVKTGNFGLEWKEGARGTNTNMAYASVCRLTDDAGTPNNDGWVFYNATGGATVTAQCSAIATGVTLSASSTSQTVLIPYNLTSSITAGTAQYFRHFGAIPFMRPLIGVVQVLVSEFPVGASFAGESGSITDHTYITVGQPSPSAAYNMAMLWE